MLERGKSSVELGGACCTIPVGKQVCTCHQRRHDTTCLLDLSASTMLHSDVVLFETHFFLVSTSIIRTHRPRSHRSGFTLISIFCYRYHTDTFTHLSHAVSSLARSTSPGSALSLVDDGIRTATIRASALVRRRPHHCARSLFAAYRKTQITETTVLIGIDYTSSPHTSPSQPRSSLNSHTRPCPSPKARPNNRNVLHPPRKTLRPPNPPPPTLPRHRRPSHLRAPRRHRRPLHRAPTGLLPEPARAAGAAAEGTRRSGSAGRDVWAV